MFRNLPSTDVKTVKISLGRIFLQKTLDVMDKILEVKW